MYGITVIDRGGLFLRGQLSFLREAGWEVCLATGADDRAKSMAAREAVAFVDLPIKREPSLLSDLVGLVKWVRLLRTIRPDAVNVSSPKAALLGGVAAWIARVPRRIYVVRGLRLEGSSGIMARVLWLMERVSLAVATDIVYVSESLGRAVCGRGLAEPGAGVVIGAGSSNGVDAGRLERVLDGVDRGLVRTSLGYDDAFVVGFLGRIAPDKGIDTLIDAFRNPGITPRARLLVMGDVESTEVADQIDVLGDRAMRLPSAESPWEVMCACDVLCLPTLREGLPNVVLEAAAVGVPAITTRATGAVDSVIDGVTGCLIDVGDSEGLVEKINFMESQPDARRQMGREAYERAVRDFAPERIWRGLLSIMTGTPDNDVRRV